MRGPILSAVLFVAALGGCYSEVGYSAGVNAGYSTGAPVASGDAYVATPDLVAVSPGVQVVADYDEPVFFTDGFYWRFYDGYWYRSNNYATGWYYYERPPEVVLRIDRPYAYAHYRPAGYVARNRPRYQPAPIVRDHRQPEPAYRERPGYRSEPPTPRPEPVGRDHREGPPGPGYRSEPPTPRPEPVGRDHREEPPAARGPAPAAAPAPVVRDHRQPPPAKKEKEETRDHRH